MATVTISVKALIPVVEYGSLTIDATWTEEINEEVDRSEVVIEGVKRLQNDMAMALLPLVESEVDRAASVLLKDHDPDAFMRRNCKIYNWFKIVNPDVVIPAMATILENRERRQAERTALQLRQEAPNQDIEDTEFGADDENKRKAYNELNKRS